MDDDTLILDYDCERGAAKIYAIAEQDKVWFCVFLLQAQDDGCIVTETPFTSFLAANVLFLDFVEWATSKNTKGPFQPCCHDKEFLRSCSLLNCPKKRGGRSFWTTFRGACLYRKFCETSVDVINLHTR